MNKAFSIVLTLAAAVAFLSSCKPSQPAAAPEPTGTPKARRHTRLDTCGRDARFDPRGGDARLDPRGGDTCGRDASFGPGGIDPRSGNPGGIDPRSKRNADCERGRLRKSRPKGPCCDCRWR